MPRSIPRRSPRPGNANLKEESPSRRIDDRVAQFTDWRGRTLARLRSIIRRADPRVEEAWKWNVPVWCVSPGGAIICTGETYKSVVKLTFARGAALEDPAGLFNSSLAGKTRRAIDVHKGDKIDAKSLAMLVRAAVAMSRDHESVGSATQPARSARRVDGPRLLSGGNPQIAKADGDAPVQAYINAMPGWKSKVGRRLDRLITRTLPDVRKAVKWNSPFYGGEGGGWFLAIHCFTNYVKVAFFNGASLRPLPPGESKSKDSRYLDIREGDQIDERRFASWVKQAGSLPGWGGS